MVASRVLQRVSREAEGQAEGQELPVLLVAYLASLAVAEVLLPFLACPAF